MDETITNEKAGYLLDVQDVFVRFRVYEGYLKVLDGVNFNVRPGERVGLVGETGCGKTTLMKTIMRILAPNAAKPDGKVFFEGSDVLGVGRGGRAGSPKRPISMVFQDPTAALNPVFTVGSQMADAIRAAIGTRADRKEVHRISVDTLNGVSLADPERILNSYPFQLSGGMRQRVCIAMAIAVPGGLLIADEPGTSLDVTIQDQILRLLQDIVKSKGTSVILITHSLGVVREMSDRAYVMYAGSMVENALSKELVKDPLHPYTQGLVASVPRLTGGGIAVGISGRIPNYLNPPTGCRFHPRCTHVMPVCSRERPSFYEVSDRHYVSCFLFGGGHHG